MPTRLRKVRKYRGSRNHGWGQVGQHKGRGKKGGFGKSGGHKQGWTHTVKYDQDRYGKKGFTRPRSVSDTTLNVGNLDALAEKFLAEHPAAAMEESVIIDLDKLGYSKLLGSGIVTKKYSVTVKKCSRLAVQKIEAAQGTVQNA